MSKSTEERTKAIYSDYKNGRDPNRDSLFHNPEVTFQVIASDIALSKALRSVVDRLDTATMLDVGCGSGNTSALLLRLGFSPTNIVGIDVQCERVHSAKARYPSVDFQCMDASRMVFPDQTFDVVIEATMFLQLTDDSLARCVADEMVRTCRVGGHILISDWRYGKPGSGGFKAVNQSRIQSLFSVGDRTVTVATFNGALVPPIGRRISKFASPMYFLLSGLFPLLVGQQVTVLRKLANQGA
jgi:SAM-dependent methyltransferase